MIPCEASPPLFSDALWASTTVGCLFLEQRLTMASVQHIMPVKAYNNKSQECHRSTVSASVSMQRKNYGMGKPGGVVFRWRHFGDDKS